MAGNRQEGTVAFSKLTGAKLDRLPPSIQSSRISFVREEIFKTMAAWAAAGVSAVENLLDLADFFLDLTADFLILPFGCQRRIACSFSSLLFCFPGELVCLALHLVLRTISHSLPPHVS